NEAVLDHPDFERRFAGAGPELDPLEYEVKAYLALGGALHDAAITAWSIKGAYDYVRPISAIRFMAKNGQATDPNLPNYNQFGLKLDSGFIETIGDFSEIENTTSLATVKARGWIGPEAIDDPETDVAGVGWINPTMWYPYQRPTFVTPNFAGYVSGHSTYSAAAATVLEKITGSPFFPGGMAEFVAEKDSFLVFEEGPSQDVVLQWATYRDASDQTSLSRIWGGIHPPADDIPGRVAGTAVGEDAFTRAAEIFGGNLTSLPGPTVALPLRIYPNPVSSGTELRVELPVGVEVGTLRVYDATGRLLRNLPTAREAIGLPTDNLRSGLYFLRSADGRFASKFVVR
ncbi:MAG: T9SS type A sorting domain-containing protein, partial [Bacteroidota bacterium]